MRFLIVSPYLPHSTIGHGGGMSTYHLIRYLAKQHDVTVLCFQRSGEDEAARDLPSQGIRLETVQFRSESDHGWTRLPLIADRLICRLKSFFNHRPMMVEKYHRREMEEKLAREIQDFRPDVVQIEYFFMAPYAKIARFLFDNNPELWQKKSEIRGPAHPIVFLNTHEAGTLARLRRCLSPASLLEKWVRAWDLETWGKYEKEAIRWADEVLCVTEQDRVLLKAISGSEHLKTLPLGVDSEGLPEVQGKFQEVPRLLFVGSFAHTPNTEAVKIFLMEILPTLEEAGVVLHVDIVGPEPAPELFQAASPFGDRVQIHGFVENLDPYFEQAWLFVAPLFSGGGIKIKILEAMGRGICVLTTPIGIEGIDAMPDRDFALAGSVDEFARSIVQLLASPEELKRIGRQGRKTIHERYGWATIVQTLAHMAVESSSKNSP